jgi:ABC-2 type transport system ATP-binding protein
VSAALRVRGVAKLFGEVRALRSISFDAAGGEVVAVVGPNGAGKTTLLSIIAGTQRPDAGSVQRTLSSAAGSADIGWVPQQPALYSKLSVTENLSLFAHLEGVVDPAAAVERMLEQAGLAERADERLENLSGGNRQRVNVAIGLIADPPVLALDEPSTALDPGQRERLWEFIGARAKRGTSVLFSTHIASEAQRYADRLIVLDAGELLFDGAPQAFMAEAGEPDADIERALIAFLAARGR